MKWAEPDIQRLYRPCVESLYGWTTEGELAPVLAAEPWQASRDQLVYTVRVKDGVTFHDGSPLTAESVVTSYRSALDPANASQWSPRLAAGLESVEPAGSDTVTFRLARPFSPFETLLALIPIVPSTIVYRPQETYARALVGTGPFRLDSWGEDGVLRYRSFDEYRGRSGHVQELEVWFGDAEAASEELATGTTQLAVAIGPDWDGQAVTVAPRSIVRYRALANLDPTRPTSSLAFRRTLSATIDRAAVVSEALGDKGLPMYSLLSPTTSHALDEGALLAATGETVPDTAVAPPVDRPLIIVSVDDPTVRSVAAGVQDALDEMGIDSQLSVVSGGAIADTLRLGEPDRFGDFDLLVAGSFAQPLTGFAPDYAYFERHSGMVTNVTKVVDAEFDRLLDEAVAAPPDERAFRWGAVQRYDVTSSLVEIPIVEGRYGEVIGEDLGDYEPSPMGTLDGLAEI